MSVPTTLQAKTIPFAISENNSVFYNLVCLKAWNFSGETTTTDEETQCGTFRGLNANSSSFDFEIIVNTTPDGDEKSAADILNYWNSQTQLYARVQPGAGLNISSVGYLTNIAISATVGSLVSMTGTFSNEGDPTIS